MKSLTGGQDQQSPKNAKFHELGLYWQTFFNKTALLDCTSTLFDCVTHSETRGDYVSRIALINNYLGYIHKSINKGEIKEAGEYLNDFFYNWYKPNQLASTFMFIMQFGDDFPHQFHKNMYAIFDAFNYSYQFLNDEFEED